MLKIDNLHVEVEGKEILKGVNLNIGQGEVHAIMGPNGSGKSTLAYALAGREDYKITKGSIQYLEKNLLSLSIEERAQRGIFLGFQYPVEIPGVANINLLKASLNATRKKLDMPELDAMDFVKLVKEKIKLLGIEQEFLYRSINEGFSGGEKKRNEILQMLVLEPTLTILDETDSGLDIDALKIVAKGINAMRPKDRSIILITHYQRLLDYVEPDYVHVLSQGRIISSGDKELAHELEAKGYDWLLEPTETAEVQ